MTVHSPQTPAHGEVIEIRSRVAHAQDGAVEAVPAPKVWRKKPVEVIAHRIGDDGWPDEIWQGVMDNKIILHMDAPFWKHVQIHTLEGVMVGDVGDWIIRGVKGEFYPCKPDIFAKTYEPAMAPAQVAPVDPLPAYYTPDSLIDDLMDELAEAREMVAYLTRANEALTAERDQWVKHTRNAVWADSEELKQAEAEVVRLRACVDAVMADRKLIIEARICPSCRDSLDLPSGDGCANMPAHDPLGRVIPVNLEDL